MTGVVSTRPAAPKPSTGVPSDASVGTAKPDGNDVPTVVAAAAPVAPIPSTTRAATTGTTGESFTTASSGQLRDDSGASYHTSRARMSSSDRSEAPASRR